MFEVGQGLFTPVPTKHRTISMTELGRGLSSGFVLQGGLDRFTSTSKVRNGRDSNLFGRVIIHSLDRQW